jgi:hypothetical protein
MANRKETGTCEQCGVKYLRCRFNKHHQKYCTRKSCVIKRRRERQRMHYRRAYRNDTAFADAERNRCKNGIRKRREDARRRSDEVPAGSNPTIINLELFAAGLLSQWIDSKDPVEVEDAARRLEKRGQQVAVATLAVRGSPILGNFQTVPLHSLEVENPVPLHSL